MIKARVGCPPVSLLESWDRSQGPRTGKGLSVQEAALSPSKSGVHLEGNTVLVDIDPTLSLMCCVIWGKLYDLSVPFLILKCLVMRIQSCHVLKC